MQKQAAAILQICKDVFRASPQPAHPGPGQHLHQIRRGTLDDEGLVHAVGGPSSHLLASYARSNVLIHVPIGTEHAATGDTVEIWRIDD